MQRPDPGEGSDDETPPIPGGDLTVVSNRQPYSHVYEEGDGDGSIAVDRPAGGLTAGLDPVMQRIGGTWVAWGDGDADREVTGDDGRIAVPPSDPAYALRRLWLTDEEVEGYYRGYANRALWPLCHAHLGQARFDADDWRTYRRVNRAFADAVLEEHDGGTIWFQDYHFALAPDMVREARPSAFCAQFWHIPWPGPDVLRACPQRRPLLEGLLGNDLLGFHVERYCRNFLECVAAELPTATVDRDAGRVEYGDRTTTVAAFPMGVDVEDIKHRAAAADGSFWRRFRTDHGIDADARVALGVDRVDYTKGIPRRIEALERLWERRPEFRGDLVYVQKGAESRSGIPAYREHQRTVREAIDRVNGRFGTDDWTPIVYTDEMYDREELCSLYRHADLGLVTPVRDGMNLVAQEYAAAQIDDDGALVLSDQAGASDRLDAAGALSVSPFDPEAVATTVERALTMAPAERRRRCRSLRRAVGRNDIYDWMNEFLTAAGRVESA